MEIIELTGNREKAGLPLPPIRFAYPEDVPPGYPGRLPAPLKDEPPATPPTAV